MEKIEDIKNCIFCNKLMKYNKDYEVKYCSGNEFNYFDHLWIYPWVVGFMVNNNIYHYYHSSNDNKIYFCAPLQGDNSKLNFVINANLSLLENIQNCSEKLSKYILFL